MIFIWRIFIFVYFIVVKMIWIFWFVLVGKVVNFVYISSVIFILWCCIFVNVCFVVIFCDIDWVSIIVKFIEIYICFVIFVRMRIVFIYFCFIFFIDLFFFVEIVEVIGGIWIVFFYVWCLEVFVNVFIVFWICLFCWIDI